MRLFIRDGYYHLNFYDEVEKRRRRISTRCKKKSDALKFISNIKQEIQKQQTPTITIKKFSEEYKEFISLSFSTKYSKTVKHSFNMLFKSFDMNRQLSSLTVRELEQFFVATYKRTPYGALSYYRSIKSAFSKAVLWEYLKENPMKKIKLPRPPRSHQAFLTKDELQLILDKEPIRDYRDFYILAFYTGMRLNEITQLRWYAIDFKNKEIKVMNDENFTSKSKKDRLIPMNDITYDLLLARLPKITSIKRDDFVFEKVKGISLRGETVSNNFRKALRKTNLTSKIHFHSLRHSFASNLVMKGVSLYVVKELLGHSDYATTQIYAHLQKESLVNAVAMLK